MRNFRLRSAIAFLVILGVTSAAIMFARTGHSPEASSAGLGDSPSLIAESRGVPVRAAAESREANGSTAFGEAAAAPGRYEAYTKEKLAYAETGDVVLFFKAVWCPSCRALDADLQARKKEIPSTLTVLTLDYDTETELKKKYGVTTQHTLVAVDANGNLLKKWSGGGTLETILAEL